MSKKILILTPYDRETMTNIIMHFKEEFRTHPIEIQSPALLADLIYKQVKKTTKRSYFHCFLASLDSYKNMSETDNVFITSAPIKIMLGNSVKEILYHEIWVYDVHVTSTQEAYIDDYMVEYEGAIDEYLKLYKSTEATRRFTNLKTLTAAILKELANEMKTQ